MSISNKLKIKNLPIIFLLIIFSIPAYFSKKNENDVSNRELLMLAIMSYSNNQKQNVTEMIDEKFSEKWFAGYADVSELQGWETVDYIINTDLKKMGGFSVVLYKKENNLVIAFRGTDSGIVQENWEYFLANREHPQAKYVSQFIDSLKNASYIDYNTKIYLTGHSLGGYLATFALGKILGIRELKNKVVKATTFNGLGLGFIADKAMLKRLFDIPKNKLKNYAVKGDLVALIGKHFTKIKYLEKLKQAEDKLDPIRTAHFPYNFLAQTPFLKA